MAKDTCKIRYNQAKERDDKKEMEFWKDRFVKKGGKASDLGEDKSS